MKSAKHATRLSYRAVKTVTNIRISSSREELLEVIIFTWRGQRV